jgi:CCR4-NOT complex subunit CAF16
MVRDDLLTFLKSDSERRGATILCTPAMLFGHRNTDHLCIIDATHIFDGLNDFPTHVAHMRLGAFVTEPTSWPFSDPAQAGRDSQLYSVALRWLREDREHRRDLEKSGRKLRGARHDEVSRRSCRPRWTLSDLFVQVPADSETFYKK